MSIKNYAIVIHNLKQFADAHMEVQRFKSSYLSGVEPFAREDRTFPILYVVPSSINNQRYVNTYSFKVYCLDKLNSDKTNEIAILTSTEQILRDLSIYIKESNNNLELDNEPYLLPLENFLYDGFIGWSADYNITGAAFSSDCAIPFIEDFLNNPDSVNCDIIYPPTKFLTCETLTGCTTIQTIQSDIVSLSATTEYLQSEINELNLEATITYYLLLIKLLM